MTAPALRPMGRAAVLGSLRATWVVDPVALAVLVTIWAVRPMVPGGLLPAWEPRTVAVGQGV